MVSLSGTIGVHAEDEIEADIFYDNDQVHVRKTGQNNARFRRTLSISGNIDLLQNYLSRTQD